MAKSSSKEKKTPKVLFARVGWMRFYAGSLAGDERPIGGGKWNERNVGSEVRNFRTTDGCLYGYFEPAMAAGTVNLERIDPAAVNAGRVSEVLVVFVATRPVERGQVVVGWYKNADVTREVGRRPPGTPQGLDYFCSAKRQNCVLLPRSGRRFPVPKGAGGFGQSNVCYALEQDGSPKNAPWIIDAVNYVEGYRGDNILDDPAADSLWESADAVEEALALSQGQGFARDANDRRALEGRAMNLATEYFEGNHYAVEDVAAKQLYDLLCCRDGQELRVEVKGTTTDGAIVVLTRKEVLHANDSKHSCALFVVYSMQLKSGQASGGKRLVINPWHPRAEHLTPVCYTYLVDHKNGRRL